MDPSADKESSRFLESKVMDWLRFPMAVLVVLIHTGSLGGDSPYPVYSTLCILFPKAICQLAVPLFFMISGYLFFNGLEKWDKDVYLTKLKRRVRSLLIPYILWNIIAIVLYYSYSAFRMRLHGESFISFPEQLQRWKGLRIFWDCDHGMPLDYPLWYVRDLIVFVIASPLILAVIRKMKWGGIAVLGALHLAFGEPNFFMGLLFFSTGCCLRVCGKSILEVSRTIRWPALVASCLLLLAIELTFRNHRALSDLLVRIFMLTGVFSVFYLVSLAFKMHYIGETSFLSKCSFFVFASHGILILNEFSHYIVLHTLPLQGEPYYCVDLFLRPAIAIAICLGLYWVLSRVAPRTLSLLTGGRAKPRIAAT